MKIIQPIQRVTAEKVSVDQLKAVRKLLCNITIEQAIKIGKLTEEEGELQYEFYRELDEALVVFNK